MAHKSPVVDDLLHLASAPRSRSVVMAAAVSFAVCHVVVLATAPAAIVSGDLDAEIPRQLVQFAAVLCRFAVPFGILIVGMMHRRTKAKLKL
jgi:hypothetical protein